jgi:hypothetical protein
MPPFETPDAVSQPVSQIPPAPPVSSPPPEFVAQAIATPDPGPPTYRPMQTEVQGGLEASMVIDTAAAPPPPAETPQAPAPVQSPAQAHSDQSLAAALESNGIDLSRFNSPREAFDLLLQMANDARANAQYVRLGQQAAGQWDSFQQWQQAQQQAQAPQTPPAPQTPEPEQLPAFQWEAPPWNPRWLDQIDQGTGELKPGADPTILSKIMDYQSWLQDRQHQFWQNPADLIHKAVTPKLAEATRTIEQQIEQRVKDAIESYHSKQAEAAAQREAEARFNAHRDKFFRRNEQGYVRDPLTGNFALTRQGEFYQTRLAEANRYGMDQQTAEQYAFDRLEEAEKSGAFAAAAPQALPQAPNTVLPADIHRQNQTSFMDEALAVQRAGQRDGTIPDNPHLEPARQPLGRPQTAQELVAETIAALG